MENQGTVRILNGPLEGIIDVEENDNNRYLLLTNSGNSMSNLFESITISNGTQDITLSREELVQNTLRALEDIRQSAETRDYLAQSTLGQSTLRALEEIRNSAETAEIEPPMRTEEIVENICPITQEQIINKMTLSCGHSFEQSAILEWILNNQNDEGDST